MSSVSSLNSLLSSTTSSSSSALNLSSLLSAATGATSTGIDVNAAVAAAVYAAQAPERQWQAQQATVQSQITALTSIQTATTQIASDLTTLADPLGSLAARTVSSSNSAAVTATASAGTSTGTHTISVQSIASAASWYSPALASASSSLGSSSLTIAQASGTSTTFSLSSSGNNTLSGLVSSINSANLGITASVVQDATGARLALVGSNTGAGADFTVTDGATSSASWSSAQVANPSTALTASTFQVSDGNTSLSVSVAAGSTLADVANQINQQASDITASVVTSSSGSYLSINSAEGQGVSVSTDPTLVLTQASHAQNASLTVDGVPVSSASNTVQGALTGITLDVSSVTQSSQVTLSVSADTSSITKAVSQFVTDYNTAASLVSSQFQYSTSTSSQGALGSDATLRTLQSTLLGIGAYTGASSSDSGTKISLATLGITMNDDGTLSLDSGVLNQAVASNPQEVQNFFQGTSSNGFAANFKGQLATFTSPGSGAFASELSNLTKQYNELQSDVNDYEAGYIATQKTLLTSMYSKAEIALQSLPASLKQLETELGDNSGS